MISLLMAIEITGYDNGTLETATQFQIPSVSRQNNNQSKENITANEILM